MLQRVYDSNGNPLDNVYVDRNNDGIINENDRYYKAIRPRWTYGFSTSLTYKIGILMLLSEGRLED